MNSKPLFLLVWFVTCFLSLGELRGQENSGEKQAQEKFEFNALENLENWKTLGDAENHWALEEGQLVCSKRNSPILQQLDLPEVIQLDVAISYEGRELNLVLGLGAPTDKRQSESKLPRLETWESAMVLNSEDDFSIIYETIPEERIELSITYDQPNRVVTIVDANGKQLCKQRRLVNKGIPAGVFLNDRIGNGSLKIGKLTMVEGESEDSSEGDGLGDR